MLEYEKYIKDKFADPKQLVVMLHGYGSNKEDLITLAPELSKYLPHALFISPNAPFEFEGLIRQEYRQWFSLLDRSDESIITGLESVNTVIVQFILDKLKENNLTEEDLCLLGFSQGTMLSLYLALESLIKPRLILGYSGKIKKHPWKCGNDKKTTHIMLIHGYEDDIIPVATMKETKEVMVSHGFPTYTYVSKHLAHGIDSDGIYKGGDFMHSNFSKV
jgi:phospholipase/carboxylesterase